MPLGGICKFDVNTLMAYKNKNRNIIAPIKVTEMFAFFCCFHRSELKARYFPIVMCNETRCAGHIFSTIRPTKRLTLLYFYFIFGFWLSVIVKFYFVSFLIRRVNK